MARTKHEVLLELTQRGESTTADDTYLWREAFDMYNAVKGTKMRASERCSKCHQLVLDWLQDTEA